jgi:hypothetical protein
MLQKYPKFKEKENCAYPKREDCNYGNNYERCPYMKCISIGNWHCIYKKSSNNDIKVERVTNESIK